VITPEQFGIKRQPLDALVVGDAEESFEMIRVALAGKPGPTSDMVALNAGATIYAADLADSLERGVERAQEILESKAGVTKLKELAAYTQQFAGQD